MTSSNGFGLVEVLVTSLLLSIVVLASGLEQQTHLALLARSDDKLALYQNFVAAMPLIRLELTRRLQEGKSLDFELSPENVNSSLELECAERPCSSECSYRYVQCSLVAVEQETSIPISVDVKLWL